MAVQITVEGQTPKYLTAPTYILGRSAECDVRLPENDRMVSRQHARLERGLGETWWIEDLSTNGTFINGERMWGRRVLQDGDQIGIGRTQVSFSSSAPPAPLPAPAHNAETFFVPAGEVQARVQAKLNEAASRLPAPSAPSPRPVWSKATPGDSPATPVANARDAAQQEKPNESLNGSAAAVQEAPLPSEEHAGEDVNTSESNTTQVGKSEKMKQCERCQRRYALEEDGCPNCGSPDFSIKGSSPATVVVTAPTSFAASSTSPLSPSPSPSPPQAEDAKPAVASGAASGATPFDRMTERAVAPSASNGVASVPPVPFTPRAPAELEAVIPAGVTFGPASEHKTGPSLWPAALGCGVGMLLSLLLPWAEVSNLFESRSISYIEVCRSALRAGSGSARLGALAPALAALISLGAALTMLAARRVGRGSSLALAAGGALGLLGAGLMWRHLAGGSSGLGLLLFVLSSLGALVVGLSRKAARDSAK